MKEVLPIDAFSSPQETLFESILSDNKGSLAYQLSDIYSLKRYISL